MSSHALRILIVDDEADTCENLSDILTDFGYQVEVAYDGPAALRLVEKSTFDVALLDLRMPGMTGLELYQHIKQSSSGTVAIIITAYATGDTARSAMEAGAWRIISKPVDIPQLAATVREAADCPLVLVVEGDSELCGVLWTELRGRNFRVQLARDSQQAERALRSRDFQVILLDLESAGENGRHVLDLIHQCNKQAQTIIINKYSQQAEEAAIIAGNEGGASVCSKPIDMTALLSAIRQVAEKRMADSRADATQREGSGCAL